MRLNFYFKFYLIFLFLALSFSFKSFAACPVDAQFTYTQLCTSGTVQFTDASTETGWGNITDWLWDFGDGSPTSILQNPYHTYVPGFSYTVELTITDASGCHDHKFITIYVYPLPTVGFSFNPNNVCSGTPIIFTNTSTGALPTYLWNFGDGNTSTQINPNHTYTTYGSGTVNFTVTLTITDKFGCTATTSQVVTINQQPDVLYYEPSNYTSCLYTLSSISDTATISNFSPGAANISSYTINWGDGGGTVPVVLPFDATHPITHIYSSMGYFPITITATGTNGCQTITHQTFVIESNPVSGIIGPAMGTNVGCAPLTISVVNASSNISTTTINTIYWGDGTSQVLPPGSVGSTITHTYATSSCVAGVMTSFQITLVAKNFCDSSFTTWAPIKVYRAPQALFTASKDSACINEPIIFTNSSLRNECAANSISFYTWDFGDGTTYGPVPVALGTQPQQVVSHTYTAVGNYTVTLTATNNSTFGCGSTDTTMLIVITETFAQFSADTVCFGSPTTFVDSSYSPGTTIVSWLWNFGDGTTSTAQNPAHVFTAPGLFYTLLTATNKNGCTDTIHHWVKVDSLPIPLFIAPPVCVGDSVHFINNSHGSGSPIATWLWNFGDGTTSTALNPVHLYSAAGTYNVTLTVTDMKGCVNLLVQTVIVNPPPVANFNATIACFGQPTIFTNTSTSPVGVVNSWSWNFGDGIGTSTLANPTYTYGTQATFNVTLIITNTNGCKDTIVKPVNIFPVPIAQFVADTVCFGSITNFTDQSTNGGVAITGWSWNFGDATTSTLQNPTHTYLISGTFNVQLIITNANGCKDTIIKPVIVNPLPVANFSANIVCLGIPTLFTDLSTSAGSTIVSWLWNFGDGTTSTLQNPSHVYASSGNFNVSLLVTDAKGCSKNIVISVQVNPLPTPNFVFTSGCLNFPVNFTDASFSTGGALTSWTWDFDDGVGVSSTQNPVYTYIANGTYNVSLIVTDINGCSDTVIKPISVTPTPIADFTADTACFHSPNLFTDLSLPGGASPINNWLWDFGDAQLSATQNPNHIYLAPGTYNAQLIVSNANGCKDTIVKPVVVDSLPLVSFSSIPVCYGGTTIFSNTSSGQGSPITSWNWNFGDLSNSNVQNPTHDYLTSGNYSVILTATDAKGCKDSITNIVNVYPLPVASFNTTTACFGQITNFTNTSTSALGAINSWSWTFGDGIGSSILQNPNYTYGAQATYNVTLVVQNTNGCIDTVINPVSIFPIPVAQFAADTVCLHSPTHFSDLSVNGGVPLTTWSWNFGDASISALQNPTHTYLTSGTFNVQLIISNANGCGDTIIKTVIVRALPIPNFSNNSICLGNITSFNDLSTPAGSPIASWNWSFGDLTNSLIQNPSHTYLSDGNFSATLLVIDGNGCRDSITHPVTVYPLPVASFTSGISCLGSPVSFTNTSTSMGGAVNSWSWQFGDGVGVSILQNPTYNYPSVSTYPVTLAVSDIHGCLDTIIQNVTINPLPIANFTFDTVCLNSTTHFTDLSTSSVSAITTWIWNFGDGTTSASQNPTHVYLTSGTFNVTLIVTNANGCKDTIIKSVLINPLPTANFSATTVQQGSPTVFSDLSTPAAAPIVGWNWNFGDGTSSTVQNPSHIYSTAGTFNVILTVTDANGCTNSITYPVIVNPSPQPQFLWTTSCFGYATAFTDISSSAGGSIVGWNWDFGDTFTSLIQNPTHMYGSAGTYTVTLIVTDINGSLDTVVNNIIVNPQPIAQFSTLDVCSGKISTFNDLSTPVGSITSWQWNFGDLIGSSNFQSPTYQYAAATTITTYNVNLIVTDNNGCKDTIIHPININPIPIPSFTFDTVCTGSPTHFVSTSTSTGGAINSWQWSFGNGSGTSNVQTPNYVYPSVLAQSTFITQMIVTDINGCTDSISHPVIVNPIPVVAFTADTACFGNINTFTDFSSSNGATLVSWNWNFGDGIGTSTAQNTSYEYQTWGLFPASLTVSDNIGCTATLIHQVLVDSLPIPEFTFTNACSGSLTDFFDASLPNGSSLSSWYWDFGDQYYSSLQDPSHFFTNQGTFNVTIHVTNARGCSDSITHPITINPVLDAEFSADTVCFGFQTQFTDWLINPGTTVATWAWDFGDGTTSNIHNPAHVYTNAGIHTVVLTVTDSQGCTDIVIHQIFINSSPTANFSSTTVILGNATSFTDLSTPTASPIFSWNWNFGDGTTSNVQNPSHTYALPGTFNTTLIITDANGCKDTIVLPVIVNPFIIAEFSSDIVCEGYPTHFTDNSSIASGTIVGWNWNFGDGTTSIVQNPTHVYSLGGTYTATLIVTGSSGGTDTIQHIITVYPKPTANFSAISVCINDVTTFTDLSTIPLGSIVSWYWNFDDGNTSNLQNPSHTYIYSGIFNVMLIVISDQGCKDTVFIGVRVHANPIVDFTADPREGCEPLFVNFVDISTAAGATISNWLWDFGDGQTSISPQTAGHSYLNNGSYNVTLTVTSNFGCVATATITDMILVHPNPNAGFVTSPNSSTLLEPVLNFIDESAGASQWIWNFGDGHGSSVQSPHHEFADTGSYFVTQYVYNVYGCMDTASQIVHILPEYSFYVPNTFTPDGNGTNDHFFPKGTQFSNTDNIMYVFDRWGEMIFTTKDLNEGWDGTYKGAKVQVGVYVWRIITTDWEGNKRNYMGHVNVIR